MASLPTIFLPALHLIGLCVAQQLDGRVAVPADFPKAFITAMAVGVVCVVVLLTLVCVLAHCWQHILRWRRNKSSSQAPERWVDPVSEWPQRLNRQSRNNRKRRRQRQGRRELRNTASRGGMLREWA
ncbi:hypothetical protein F4776DRAFT_214446 [Hypoxylon sp. NC0597]|nr:hypothetical protein F4776DRAFT_214446 [Hypoxylon sp. NC0597]